MKVKVWVMTDKIRSEMERVIEIDDEDIEDYEEDDIAAHVDGVAFDEVLQMIEWGWEEV